ncbi:MAG: hypothetical protein ABI706_11285 [Ilumatobacteraceae bacterium]
MTMNNEQPGVGFFRGLLAVLRGIAHAAGTALGLLGRGLAAITRRSPRTKRDGTREG